MKTINNFSSYFLFCYLTILCFDSVGSIDCSDAIVGFVGFVENKSANHPRSLSLVSDAPLQHTAQIFYFIFVK